MVVSDADGKVCFAQSLPILQAPKTNKRDAKLFVAFRPNDNIKNEVSVTPGYEFNKNNSVTAASGKNKFKFDISIFQNKFFSFINGFISFQLN